MHNLEREIKEETALKMWVLSVDAQAAILGHQQIQKHNHVILSSSDPDV